MSDIGSVAELAKLLIGFFLKPEGWATMSREKKLVTLRDALMLALDAKLYDEADLIFAELRRMSQEAGP